MLQVFKFEGQNEVRVIEQDGEPWFVAKDVGEILGLSNIRVEISRLDSDEKKVSQIVTPSNGGYTDVSIISESGLYTLIMRSNKPQAKTFRKWVTSEVLPSIRRHGLYAIDDVLNDPDIMIAALQALKTEREIAKGLTEKVAIQTQQIAEMQPKATYYDEVLSFPDAISISRISKDYGWSARRMNEWLSAQGIQFKLGDIWLLYPKYAELGYTSTKTAIFTANDGTPYTKVHTYWTQKGRLFIYELMKAAGNLPLIEQMIEQNA